MSEGQNPSSAISRCGRRGGPGDRRPGHRVRSARRPAPAGPPPSPRSRSWRRAGYGPLRPSVSTAIAVLARSACRTTSGGAPSAAKWPANRGMLTPLRFECRSSAPPASFDNLAKPPATVTRSIGCRRRYLSIPPTKSPMSMIASSPRPSNARAASSEVLPVQPTTWRTPVARATSMPRWIEWIHAEHE